MPLDRYNPGARIIADQFHQVQTAVPGGDPGEVITGSKQGGDVRVGKGGGGVGEFQEVLPVETKDSEPPGRTDPEVALGVLGEGMDAVVRKPRLFVKLGAVVAEIVAVVAVQAVPGSEPHKALAVAQHSVDGVLREPVVGGQILYSKGKWIGLRRAGQ